VPSIDPTGLKLEDEEKKGRIRNLLLRWALLFGIFGVVLLFGLLIRRIDALKQLALICISFPSLIITILDVSDFIINQWHICLAAVVVAGLILEILIKRKVKLLFLYLIVLVALSALFILTYRFTAAFLNRCLEEVKEKVTEPIDRK